MSEKGKINYQLKLDSELEKISLQIKSGEKKPSLLLHSCCGPCSSYVLEYLAPYFDITVFYYNPCIYPNEEYELRKEVQKSLIEKLNKKGNNILVLEENDLYATGGESVHTELHDEFLSRVNGHESDPECGERCHICYAQRLERAAEYAYEKAFDYFTTTLTVSPYKNAAVLNEIGDEISRKYGIPYLFSDFKKREGYKRSIELSKEYNLYRQDYCGCEFSVSKID